MKYIYQNPKWPTFTWDHPSLYTLLASLHHAQGRLLVKMEKLDFPLRSEAFLDTLTLDVVKSSEIEGEILNPEHVRSSLAERLGIKIAGALAADRHVDGIVEMMLDATQYFDKTLTQKRLFDWHAALFPTGRSGMHKIIVGHWRNDSNGRMQVISGPMGKEKIHFEAPPAAKLPLEMKHFLSWFNQEFSLDPLVKAGIAHLWFVTIHPFEDGNGRIARAISDMQLARSDNNTQRFYSMSAQIRKERKMYYQLLEQTQKNSLDITEWLLWFLHCLERALIATEETLSAVLQKSHFWEKHNAHTFNERQLKLLHKLLERFIGKLTTTKWSAIAKCSQDTALRDIQDLIQRGILIKDSAGGRSTGYLLSKHREKP